MTIVDFLRHQVQLFFTALMFYTRIPVPKWVGYSAEQLNRSSIYFPLVGWIVGGVAVLAYIFGKFVFGSDIGIVLSMVATILLTGAFHEDGFADVCDGFGGGWKKKRILEIMKDSRVGAYGMIGMVLLLLLKFIALKTLHDLPMTSFWVIFLIAHPLSRFIALTFVYTHEYVREDATSKAKPVAMQLSPYQLLVAAIFAGLPLLLFSPWALGALVIAPLFLLKLYLGYYFKKWISGYTGDCLGATQQLAEVIIYLYFVGIIRLIGSL